MAPAPNAAEELVARLARESFLALWSYANPRGKNGKELCDILAVCDPDVVIFSVKDIAVGRAQSLATTWERWQRAAIEGSAKQIYGAERWLRTAARAVRADDSSGVSLPPVERRRVHRVAVALGSRGSIPIYMGDFGRGFVHVLTEESLDVILRELDTVDDLTSYLTAKEELAQRSQVIFNGDERDLLAMYLSAGRQLPTEHDLVIVDEGIWESGVRRPEYEAKMAADVDSYEWDRLIDLVAHDVLQGRLEFGSGLDNNERALRVMARENRLARRILGRAFKEFLDLSRTQVLARLTQSPSGIVYVFLAKPRGYPREARTADLANRCFVARGLHPSASEVVGVATEQYLPGQGYSLDLVYTNVPQWTATHQGSWSGCRPS